MLKTSSSAARTQFRVIRKENATSHKYISFIHQNFPQEEDNQYLALDWRAVASDLGISISSQSLDSIRNAVRAADREALRRSPEAVFRNRH